MPILRQLAELRRRFRAVFDTGYNNVRVAARGGLQQILFRQRLIADHVQRELPGMRQQPFGSAFQQQDSTNASSNHNIEYGQAAIQNDGNTRRGSPKRSFTQSAAFTRDGRPAKRRSPSPPKATTESTVSKYIPPPFYISPRRETSLSPSPCDSDLSEAASADSTESKKRTRDDHEELPMTGYRPWKKRSLSPITSRIKARDLLTKPQDGHTIKDPAGHIQSQSQDDHTHKDPTGHIQKVSQDDCTYKGPKGHMRSASLGMPMTLTSSSHITSQPMNGNMSHLAAYHADAAPRDGRASSAKAAHYRSHSTDAVAHQSSDTQGTFNMRSEQKSHMSHEREPFGHAPDMSKIYQMALDASAGWKPVKLADVQQELKMRKQREKAEATDHQRQVREQEKQQMSESLRREAEQRKAKAEDDKKEKERIREKKKRLAKQRHQMERENSQKELGEAISEYKTMEKELVDRFKGLGREASDYQISEKLASPKTRKTQLEQKEAHDKDKSKIIPAPALGEKAKVRLITPLTDEWEAKVKAAVDIKSETAKIATSVDGTDLTRRDLGRLLPRGELVAGSEPWLNDEVINAWYANLCARLNEKDGYVKGPNKVPRYVAYNTGWYTSATNKGVQSISGWSRRKGIKNDKLLRAQQIFFPINTGAHWTLLTISGVNRTIEYYDSLSHRGWENTRRIGLARDWLKMELGSGYKEDEWTVLQSKSSIQSNGNDCGVFACLNGWALCKGSKDPSNDFDASDIPLARRLFAATLLNGGFSGQFDI